MSEIYGNRNPDRTTIGVPDQIYINNLTGEKWVCVAVCNTKLKGLDNIIYLWDKIGSHGKDVSLGLINTSVGNSIKVKTVNESGIPIEWEIAEFPDNEDSGQWEYIGEFTESTQPTFESGKYRFFYAEAFFTSENSGANAYRYICIDGYGYLRWALANKQNQSARVIIMHGLCAIVQSKDATTYPSDTDRGTAMFHRATVESTSIGTAFWKTTDTDNCPMSTFGIKLWGAK